MDLELRCSGFDEMDDDYEEESDEEDVESGCKGHSIDGNDDFGNLGDFGDGD